MLSGDLKLLRQSIRTRSAFTTLFQKLRALPSYKEILTTPMALRVIRIAETQPASAETRGIDLYCFLIKLLNQETRVLRTLELHSCAIPRLIQFLTHLRRYKNLFKIFNKN